MAPLRLLGITNTLPCVLLIDPASPHCHVSSGYLYRTSLPCKIDPKGCLRSEFTVSVPSLGGYHTSTDMSLAVSPRSDADIILGSDWVSMCRIRFAANVLLEPPLETVVHLPDEHKWTPDGALLLHTVICSF